MDASPFKPGVAATIIIALGILIFTLLFIFAKRQIMRFAQKFSTDGPHAPIGYDAPKKLVMEIERRLKIVNEIRCEPRLINEHNQHTAEANIANYKHIYRMKAMDALKGLEDDIFRACGSDESVRRHPGADLRVYLLNLRKENMPLASCESKLINEFVESYTNARSDPIPDFGAEELSRYMALLKRIQASIIPLRSMAQSKASSPLNMNKRKTSKGSGNQAVTLKVSPTKVNTFQTQIVQQDDCKWKDNEASV